MHNFEFTTDEAAILSQIVFSDKISFPNTMSKHVVSLQEKLQPVVDALISESKEQKVTPN